MSARLGFDGHDNVHKGWTMFDFWVILKRAGDILTAFCVVHYTYFTKWSLFCGLNEFHVTQRLTCLACQKFYIQLSQIQVHFFFTRKGVLLMHKVVFIVSYNKNILFKPMKMHSDSDIPDLNIFDDFLFFTDLFFIILVIDELLTEWFWDESL